MVGRGQPDARGVPCDTVRAAHLGNNRTYVVRRRSDAAMAGLGNLPLDVGAEFDVAAGFDDVQLED